MKSLTGHLLIAMPQMADPFFAGSVVYLCSHGEESGAMGLVINKRIGSLTVDELYVQLQIEAAMPSGRPQPVHFGGPVAPDRSFVLHSAEYREAETLNIADAFALTTTLDIFQAKSRGRGPRQSLVTLGYAGWGPGQLDAEIQANGWLLVAADTDLVFDPDDEGKWRRALAKLGVNPEMLCADSGHA